jgi:small subunit ribosomal protein S29
LIDLSLVTSVLCSVPFITIMDCAQTYFQTTEYTTPEGNKLEPYHLSTPRLFLDYISGRKHFVRLPSH